MWQRSTELICWWRLQPLPSPIKTNDKTLKRWYEALIEANSEVAENILTKKRKRKGIVCETLNLIHTRNTLKSCAIKNRMKSTTSTRANLQSAKESLDKAYSKQLVQHIFTKAAQIEQLQAERQSAKAWETIRELSNKKSSPLSKVKGILKSID